MQKPRETANAATNKVVQFIKYTSTKNQIHSRLYLAEQETAELAGTKLRYDRQRPGDDSKNTIFHTDTPFENTLSSRDCTCIPKLVVVRPQRFTG